MTAVDEGTTSVHVRYEAFPSWSRDKTDGTCQSGDRGNVARLGKMYLLRILSTEQDLSVEYNCKLITGSFRINSNDTQPNLSEIDLKSVYFVIRRCQR